MGGEGGSFGYFFFGFVWLFLSRLFGYFFLRSGLVIAWCFGGVVGYCFWIFTFSRLLYVLHLFFVFVLFCVFLFGCSFLFSVFSLFICSFLSLSFCLFTSVCLLSKLHRHYTKQ